MGRDCKIARCDFVLLQESFWHAHTFLWRQVSLTDIAELHYLSSELAFDSAAGLSYELMEPFYFMPKKERPCMGLNTSRFV